MNNEDDTIDYVDTATLLKIAKGAQVPLRKMEWGRSNLFHIPISMWLEEYNLKPGRIPMKLSTLYRHFFDWAIRGNMDVIANNYWFSRIMLKHFESEKHRVGTQIERLLFVSRIPNGNTKKE